MPSDNDDHLKVKFLRQEAGKFDRRLSIGPAQWPHFDLLWIHAGEVQIDIGLSPTRLNLAAPAGLLILPNTAFSGRSISAAASASICHFECPDTLMVHLGAEYVLPREDDVFHVQNLINLSLSYVERSMHVAVKERLLLSILDCFGAPDISAPPATRLDRAWRQARHNLHQMRDLTDVAASISLTESTFRALHRKQYDVSAGHYLRELRLSQAERLLATTGDTVSSISRSVGYAQPESFSHAFSSTRGRTPAAYRRWCKRFA
jgi:AraC-like DNA-binding protein